MPEFSILICVYRKDDPLLFDRALSSIFENSLQPKEVILVCDGPLSVSLDKIVAKYEDGHPTIMKVIRLKDNSGLAGALNAGLPHITSPITVRCDADDYNLPDRFITLIGEFKNDPKIVLLGSQVRELWRSGESRRRTVPCSEVEIIKASFRRNPFNHMTVAYRTDIVSELGGYPDLHLKEDYGLWLHIIARCCKVKNVNRVLVEANFDESSISRRGGWKYVQSELSLLRLKNSLIGGRVSNLAIFVLRSGVFLLPNFARKGIYTILLRDRRA
jgi:glycosyltransferase involved in cell wall biosynthesis